MDHILEALCRRYATRVGQNGVVYLTHDNDPLLIQAFRVLGWPDRYPETGISREEVAAVESPEKAVMKTAKKKDVWDDPRES